MESEKYPKAEFKGEIKNSDAAFDFTKDGTYSVKVKGNPAMHGVSNDVRPMLKLQSESVKLLKSNS